jgi:hydrogenase maturation protease
VSLNRRVRTCLVIGYGNTLRRDDGAGPVVARVVAARGLPGVEVIEAQQLLPEHADALSRAERAVFVDARIAGEEEAASDRMVDVQRVEPSREARLAPHASDPAALLALAFMLFGHAPEAWLVTVQAVDLGIGEELSEEVAAAVPAAAAEVVRLLAAGATG